MLDLRPIELTPRLRAVAELVPVGARFADVGTDHARLPIYLLQRDIIACAIASDLRQGPLDRARQNAQHYGLTDRVSFRLCDGLDLLTPDEIDVIAIAGMGGDTIAAILTAAPWTRQADGLRLVLQPMSAIPELRCFLQKSGYRIVLEQICREGDTLYTVILAEPGEMLPFTPAELWAGRETGAQDPTLRKELLDLLCHRAEKALEGIRRSLKPSDVPRREALEQVSLGLIALKAPLDGAH